MHWLPLVAMVIASALPFPQSPVPRLVAATIEPGRNNSNSSSITTAEISMTNSSVHNTSHNGHSMRDVTPPGTVDKQRALTHDEDKGRENQENLVTKRKFVNKTQQGYTSGGRTAGADASRSHAFRKYRSQKSLAEKINSPSNNILKDYQLERRQFHEESSIDTETLLKDDSNTGNKVKEESLEGPKVSLQSSPQEAQIDWSTIGNELRKPDGGFRMEPGFGKDIVHLREDQLLHLDAHPRVLFSSDLSPPKHPPLLLMLELGLLDEDIEDEESHTMDGTALIGDKEAYRNLLLGMSDSENHAPVRRKRANNMQARDLSVCEAESGWVTDRKTAVDLNYTTVTVLETIQTQKQLLKQWFYETKCRKPHQQGKSGGKEVEGPGCLGVDKKKWLSRCETKQSYVRALIYDENINKIGWRWIRINSSCVCVLRQRVRHNTKRKLEK